jgi:spore coat-associated protein N
LKKIIGLAIAALIVITIAGVGTFAFFNDTESSANNIITAGTLDLKTNDANGVDSVLTVQDLAPGNSVGPATVELKNAGSIDAAHMDISVTYSENDGTEPGDPGLAADVSQDEFAAQLKVNTLRYGATDLLTKVTDANANGFKDIQDVSNSDLTGLLGLDSAATANFVIEVTLDGASTGNDFQGDGINITLNFDLQQQ